MINLSKFVYLLLPYNYNIITVVSSLLVTLKSKRMNSSKWTLTRFI